jgi:hypothetical protein
VLWLTLTPAYGPTVDLDFWCLACGDLGGVDVVANIVLFIPLGFAFALALNRRWWPLATCVTTTVLIELLQIRVVPGRDASLSDILANSLGALVGVELAVRRRIMLWPTPAEARRLIVAWAVSFTLLGAATSWGLEQAFVPRSLWVQWMPLRAGYQRFTGKLLAFDINGVDLSARFPSPKLNIDKRLMSDSWRATATVDRDGIQARPSVVARISEEVTQPFALEQRFWDLTCLQKTKSAELRFRSPRVALHDAFKASSGARPDIVRLICARENRALTAAIQAGNESREQVIPMSPSVAWTLFSPFDIPLSARTRWIGILWLMALILPAGYWASGAMRDTGHARQRTMATVFGAVGASAALGLLVLPSLAATAPAEWWEWAAALGALVLGSILSRFVHRPTARARSRVAAVGRSPLVES